MDPPVRLAGLQRPIQQKIARSDPDQPLSSAFHGSKRRSFDDRRQAIDTNSAKKRQNVRIHPRSRGTLVA
jgi:hypothetical protein